MLKIKKTTYESVPKNNELTKLTAEIKQANQKIEDKKQKKDKTINDYAKLIQSINKEYQKLAFENDLLKKKRKNHHGKQQKFLRGKRKRHHKKQKTYSGSSSGDTESEYFIPKKKEKQRKKQQKNIKGIMMMKMMI